jgi:hypothetical protein
MTKSSSFRDFYQKWVAEFEAQRLSANLHDDFWEGATAYKELTTPINLLMLLVPDTDPAEFPFTSLFELLWREIEGYRRLAGQIVPGNQELPAAKKVLAGILDQLEDLETASQIGQVTQLLQNLRLQVQNGLTSLEEARESWLKDLLKQYKTIDSEGNEIWVAADKTDLSLPLLPPDVELREKLFSDFADPRHPGTNREFDTIAQARMAAVFRQYLPLENVSLYTIARLVVLSYICADLACEKERTIKRRGRSPSTAPALVVRANENILTVGAVYQKLGDAGLT